MTIHRLYSEWNWLSRERSVPYNKGISKISSVPQNRIESGFGFAGGAVWTVTMKRYLNEAMRPFLIDKYLGMEVI